MEVPSMLDLDWQRAIREAVRPLIPVDFYGHITVNVQGEHVGDITLYICLLEAVQYPQRRHTDVLSRGEMTCKGLAWSCGWL